MILNYHNCNKDELVLIGDKLYTDIAIAVNHGVTSVLVMTGETQPSDIEDSDIKPDLVINRLIDLAAYFS